MSVANIGNTTLYTSRSFLFIIFPLCIQVIACTALYYKIKMKKLELLYEQSRINYNGSALAGLNPPVGLTGFTDSSRLTGLQQTVRFSSRNGGRVVLPHNGMSTASYIQVNICLNLYISHHP